MNFENSPIDLPSRERSDDLDDLLHAFYRAEMPDPWPACLRPRNETLPLLARPARARRTLSRSRLALAASVGLLVACLWALSGKFAVSPDVGTEKPLPGSTTGERDPNKLFKARILLKDGESSLLLESPPK